MGADLKPVTGEFTVAYEEDEDKDDEIDSSTSRRILVVDDSTAIHDDIRKILGPPSVDSIALDTIEVDLFGGEGKPNRPPVFVIDAASQGKDALDLVRDHKYAVAFVDIRMPPGWDGIETIERIWKRDPDVQVVICSAFSDYAWSEIVARLDPADRLLVLRKPFETIEIRQMAYALSSKWLLYRRQRRRLNRLKWTVRNKTRELARTMEELGQLATAVAGTADDPMKNVAESVKTLSVAVGDLAKLIARYRRILRNMPPRPEDQELLGEIQQAETAAAQALQSTIPEAFRRLMSDAAPVAALVAALRNAVDG